VGLRTWWARQYRVSGRLARTYNYLVPDSQDLLEVVESGRSALRAIDDARAAIIACYVAMETSLDEHGAARVIADTPDELLTLGAAAGMVAAAGPGAGSALLRLVAAAALITAAVLVLPYVARGETRRPAPPTRTRGAQTRSRDRVRETTLGR
jgi:hypothetical protein